MPKKLKASWRPPSQMSPGELEEFIFRRKARYMECWERLPEPMVMTPDDDSKVCHVWDLEAFVLTCGREEIKVGATVFLYPYDSVTKAKVQYDKLGWWTSKALFFCRTDHDIVPRCCVFGRTDQYIVPRCCDIYALVEWTSSDWSGTERRKSTDSETLASSGSIDCCEESSTIDVRGKHTSCIAMLARTNGDKTKILSLGTSSKKKEFLQSHTSTGKISSGCAFIRAS